MLIVAESGDAGGIGRYCVDLASGLGPTVHVACLCADPCPATEGCWLGRHCADRGVRLHRIAMPAKGWRSGLRGLAGLWRRTGRPIVHVNGRRGNSLALALRLAAPGFRYVTTAHGILGLHSRRNRAYRIVDLAAARLARVVIAVSEHGRSDLIRAGSPRRRTVTIANGLAERDLRDLGAVARGRSSASPVGETTRVGFLGRLGPEKGTHELLEIARHRHGLDAPGAIDVAGDGPDRDWLLRAATAIGDPPPIAWRGTITDPAPFLRDIDVLVMPSHNEGLPYVLLEGMAAGCAVVAFAVGGIPEVISDPALGVLVEPGDVGAFVAAVASLVDDPTLVRRIGSAAAGHVERDFALRDRLPALWDAYGLGDRPGPAMAEHGDEVIDA